MILQRAINNNRVKIKNLSSNLTPQEFVTGVEVMDLETISRQVVTPETSKNVSTAYRCINVLSDDVAKLPLQTFESRAPGMIQRVRPSNLEENISWLLEVSPNRWMTPLVFKKMVIMWLVTHGASRIWMPPRQRGRRREMFLLPTVFTKPVVESGQLWFEVKVPGHETEKYPDVEVLSLLLNSTDGINGKSVISYARETIGRQLANYETQNKIAGKGLNPSAVLYMSGETNKEAKAKTRESYEEALSGSGIAIFDPKVTKFEPITMKPVDVQFLESLQNNDVQIANFFGVPLYKVNQGKQSYESNEQQNLDYLNTTLDPYLVQWEQAAALKWLSEEEQNYRYFKFNRDALLRTDAKTRTETSKERVLNGIMTINEAREKEDLPSFSGGDAHYMQSAMAVIKKDGSLQIGGKSE